jgi:hypothetical protein
MYQPLVPHSDYLHEMVCNLKKCFFFFGKKKKCQVCVTVENGLLCKIEGAASSYPLDKPQSGCSHNFTEL